MSPRVQVLGPTRVEAETGPVELAARKQRGLLAALALDRGEVVAPDRLVDLLWGGAPPAGAFGTLHSYISGLRRTLEPGLAPRASSTVLVTSDHGYRLTLDGADVDASYFVEAARAHHRRLAPLASLLTTGPDPTWPDRDEVIGLRERLEALLATWRGTPYADLPDHPDVVAARAALEETRATVEDDLVLAMLALGEHASTIAMTEQPVQRQSLRERSWSLHALALARSGRQADALETIRRLRGLLEDELGIDPSAEVQQLETAILRQDATLLTGWLAEPRPPAADGPATDPADGRSETSAVLVPAASRSGVVGRRHESRTLLGLLDAAGAGDPATGLMVGDAGMGKSVLLRQVSDEARERGFLVAAAPVTEDNDAPPLWPWDQLIGSLSRASGTALVDLQQLAARHAADGATPLEVAFDIRQALSTTVLDLARGRPLLLVFDDLHWADTPTLRALTHLVSRMQEREHDQQPPRLAVVCARRPVASPSPALTDLEAALARAGSAQLHLDGLDLESALELVGRVGGAEVEGLAREWQPRTGGNPFFLVELARLAARDPAWRGEVPSSVQQVVARRLADLPEATRDLLVVAAALGESFSPLTLAAVSETAPSEVQDHLERAVAAGLVRDDEGGATRFEHALTRDAVLAAQPPTRLARTHARIAHGLAALPEQTRVPGTYAFELARHWLAAGPIHAPSAWRAAAAAAGEATAVSAYSEATDLLFSAVEAHRLDPFGTRAERYDLLAALARCGAAAARLPIVVASSKEATALARAEAEPAKAAVVAAALTHYSLWTPTEWGVVDEDLVDDLRWALAEAARDDHRTRCRLMLSLAAQLYYDDRARAESVALVDEGLALAQRLQDPALLAWAARAGHLALWRPTQLARMDELARVELAASTAAGDDEGRAFALTTLAALAMLRGDRVEHETHLAEATVLARRRRLPFALIGLCFVGLGAAWARGEADRAGELATEMLRIARSTAIAAQDFLPLGVALAQGLFDDEVLRQQADMLLAVAQTDEARQQTAPVAAAALARLGRVDDLRVLRPLLPPLDDYWGAVQDACYHAEVAAALGDRELAQEAVGLLRDFRHGLALSGISLSMGPVAGYLALAEHVLGNRAAASSAADLAARVADEWGFVRSLDWLAATRRRYGL